VRIYYSKNIGFCSPVAVPVSPVVNRIAAFRFDIFAVSGYLKGN